jgi:hypothetical protein
MFGLPPAVKGGYAVAARFASLILDSRTGDQDSAGQRGGRGEVVNVSSGDGSDPVGADRGPQPVAEREALTNRVHIDLKIADTRVWMCFALHA